jgi:hypothetical protein
LETNLARPQPCSHGILIYVRGGIPAEQADESVTPAAFSADDIAVRAERFPQRGDLNLEVLFRHRDVRPNSAEELPLCDERAVGLQQNQKEIKGAGAELDGSAVNQ